jgi:hypothetical protein
MKIGVGNLLQELADRVHGADRRQTFFRILAVLL